ncbi:MAG: hypothetical protein KDK04_24435 [Candidatus Competibacteraceae bacterium]|nr:hypothetical protein [Candidatus Competibacteraceae bacterium]MCB1805068.1 hypothetical protein [Candidatus Competibacteraceae bacterium]MCB1814839.1 hypothetical protein [Candidatus Competibacteraceae bacterium]
MIKPQLSFTRVSPSLALSALLALSVPPELALAQSFSLDTILPASVAAMPFLQKIVVVLAMMVLATTFVVLGFGATGAIADIFQTLSESRRMGDWGTFMKTLGIVIAVLIVATVLAVLVWDWLTDIQINPSVTIGS